MSDVNQAFLRAYVKRRAAADGMEEPGSAPSSQALPSAQESIQRRLDVPPDSASNRADPAIPTAPAAAPARPVNLGIWSALGAERGIKASVASEPPPAVVRNTSAASNSSSSQVRPQAAQPPAPARPAAPLETSPDLETLNQAWSKKRAPALKDLQSRPAPETLPTASPVSLPPTRDRSGAQARVRVDAPSTRARSQEIPQTPAKEGKTAPPPHPVRTDAPVAQRVPGPHAPAVGDRARNTKSPQNRSQVVPFAPSWEVDGFTWPEVITRLEQVHPSAFRQIGYHLAGANQSGLKVLAVTSGERGVGRSTVAMHMARAAACEGLKVALVDSDAANPSLIDHLMLDVQHGWQDCLFEAVPLEEVAVHSIADRITLFPLTEVISPQQVHANLHRMSKLIRRISSSFDLVILDSSRLNLDQRHLIGVSNEKAVDAAVVVVDNELSIKEKIDSAISILQSMGLASIGLIENFRS